MTYDSPVFKKIYNTPTDQYSEQLRKDFPEPVPLSEFQKRCYNIKYDIDLDLKNNHGAVKSIPTGERTNQWYTPAEVRDCFRSDVKRDDNKYVYQLNNSETNRPSSNS